MAIKDTFLIKNKKEYRLRIDSNLFLRKIKLTEIDTNSSHYTGMRKQDLMLKCPISRACLPFARPAS